MRRPFLSAGSTEIDLRLRFDLGGLSSLGFFAASLKSTAEPSDPRRLVTRRPCEGAAAASDPEHAQSVAPATMRIRTATASSTPATATTQSGTDPSLDSSLEVEFAIDGEFKPPRISGILRILLDTEYFCCVDPVAFRSSGRGSPVLASPAPRYSCGTASNNPLQILDAQFPWGHGGHGERWR